MLEEIFSCQDVAASFIMAFGQHRLSRFGSEGMECDIDWLVLKHFSVHIPPIIGAEKDSFYLLLVQGDQAYQLDLHLPVTIENLDGRPGDNESLQNTFLMVKALGVATNEGHR